METVQLRMAYEWTCPECGIDHFGRGIAWEGSEEERKELEEVIEIAGFPPNVGGWTRLPDKVTCPNCGKTFETEEI